MLIRALARALALAAVAVSVAACEYSPSTVDRTLAYNNAISQSTNDLFLLNAIRASQREPTYYTRNQADTTTSSITPTLSGTSPLGSTATVATAVGSNINPIGIPSGFLNTMTVTKTLTQAARSLASGLTGTESNQLALTNLDDQLSTNGLLTPVALQQMANYATLGYPAQALYLLYFQNISVSKRIIDNLPNAIAETCTLGAGTSAYHPNTYCQYFFGAPRKILLTEASVASPRPVTIVNFDHSQYGWGLNFVANHFSPACFDGATPDELIKADESARREVMAAAQNIQKIKKQQDDAEAAAKQTALTKESDVKIKPIEDDSDDESLHTVTYANDPAVDGVLFDKDGTPARTSPDTAEHYFGCFKEVLTALLVLDLTPSPTSPSKIAYRMPFALALNNPRYFADLSQQGFDVAVSPVESGSRHPAPRGDGPRTGDREVGVCKKADGPILTYSSDDYVNGVFGLDPALLRAALLNSKSTDDALLNAGVTGDVVSAGAVMVGPVPSKSPDAVIVTSPALHSQPAKTDCAGALKQAEAKEKLDAINKASGNKKVPTVDKIPTISYTPRSLEDMVYFLGQIIRRNVEGGEVATRDPDSVMAKLDRVTFWNGADPVYPYEEELFDVQTGSPSEDSIATISVKDTTYYVPKLCPFAETAKTSAPEGCTPEYPNHASALILDMLNQLWGLNKTQATAPIVPTVTVINPGG